MPLTGMPEQSPSALVVIPSSRFAVVFCYFRQYSFFYYYIRGAALNGPTFHAMGPSIMPFSTCLNKLFAIATTSVVIPGYVLRVVSCAKALKASYAFCTPYFD
jgi:hypothetical protein